MKPLEWEKYRNEVSINTIIDRMLEPAKKIISEHIQKFLDAGDQLKTLTVSRYEDGTIILRSDERTVVTARVTVEGRKIGNTEFRLVEEGSLED
jgi:hypothetical protein